MKYTYYEITIIKRGRANLKENPEIFDVETKQFSRKSRLKQFLVERYGKNVIKARKNKPIFSYSFWNRDISHNSPPWFQTDQIIIEKIHETRIPVPALI